MHGEEDMTQIFMDDSGHRLSVASLIGEKDDGSGITGINKNEERLVNVMGGTVIETESERLRKEGKVQMIVEMGQEDGLDDATILKKIQDKIGLSLEQATAYLEQYGKQLV